MQGTTTEEKKERKPERLVKVNIQLVIKRKHIPGRCTEELNVIRGTHLLVSVIWAQGNKYLQQTQGLRNYVL